MTGKNIKNVFVFLTLFACVFCLSLPVAFAADGAGDGNELQAAGTVQPAQTSDEEPDDLQYGEFQLRLIQRGDNPYSAADASDTVLGAQDISDEQMEAFKARLNNGMVNVEESIDVYDLGISLDDIDALGVMSDVVNSNPDLFYVNTGVSWSYNPASNTLVSINPSYSFEKSKVLQLKSTYETALQQVLSWVPDNATDVQKAKAVHDWLVRNCSYNTDAAQSGGPKYYVNGWQPWTAYGAIVDKSPVCQGYSLAFIAAMNRLGIQAAYVSDDTHGWNRAVINGSWFNLDVTHDDPLPDRGFSNTPITTYFLKSDAWFKANPSGSHHTVWSPEGVPGTDTRYDNYTSSTWSSEGLVYSAAASHATVTSFELSHSTLSVEPDSFERIDIVNVQPAGASTYAATWTSSNPSVATVDSSGKVCAGKSEGATTVTCTLNGISRTCDVQVHYHVPAINASNKSVCVGSSLDLLEGVTAEDENDGDITSKLTVSPTTVSTTAAGTFTVTYSVTNSKGTKATKTITVTVTNHDWNEGVETVAATCTTSGVKTFTCKACGKTTTETIPALGHSFTSYVSNGDATCTADGTKTARCDRSCGATNTVTDPNTALGHSFSNYVSNNDATCTQDGTKTAVCNHGCGETSTVADPGTALGHSFTNYVSDHNATCTVDGTKTARCDHNCGETNTIADPGTAFGHSWDEGVVTVQPTYESDGVRTYTCSTCSATRTESIARLSKTSLSTATISGLSTETYTGQAITPAVTIELDGKTLRAGVDYTLSYQSNINVGTATVSVEGQGDYAGSLSGTFTIVPANISAATASVIPAQVYNGSSIEPKPTLTRGSRTLVEGKDYRLSYLNTVNVGTATVSVEGMGNYAESMSLEFSIGPKSISHNTVSVSAIAAQTFTGQPFTPSPVVSDEETGKTLVENVDYDLEYADNVDVGQASIKVSGKGNYGGTTWAYFIIRNADDPNFAPTIIAGDATVCVGQEVDLLSFAKAQDPEDGDITNRLTVAPAAISTATVGAVQVTYYVSDSDGAQATKTITVTVANHDWNEGVVTAAATCTADGAKTFTCSTCGESYTEAIPATGHSFTNYVPNHDATCTQDGTKTADCDHGCGTVSTIVDQGTALGHSFTNYVPDHNATCTADGTMTAVCDRGCGAHDTVVDPGTAFGHSWDEGVVTVQPTTQTEGVRTYTCATCGATRTESIPKLAKQSLADATISGLKNVKYTGKRIAPSIKVTVAGKTLVKDRDYTVSYASNNVNVGTVQVEVEGIGDYTGVKKASFAIKQATNKVTVKSTSVKKTLKAKTLKKKALTVALPKASAKFGAIKWKVTSKDAKGVLKLSKNKVQVKKGAKKNTYTIKLKAYVSKAKNYSAANSKVVTVKVTVK